MQTLLDVHLSTAEASLHLLTARTRTERRKVVDADWTSMLPQDAADMLRLANPSQKYLIDNIQKKAYLALRVYFLKRKAYNSYKQLKKVFSNLIFNLYK